MPFTFWYRRRVFRQAVRSCPSPFGTGGESLGDVTAIKLLNGRRPGVFQRRDSSEPEPWGRFCRPLRDRFPSAGERVADHGQGLRGFFHFAPVRIDPVLVLAVRWLPSTAIAAGRDPATKVLVAPQVVVDDTTLWSLKVTHQEGNDHPYSELHKLTTKV